jgi:ferredoxin
MASPKPSKGEQVVMERDGLAALFQSLSSRGYRVVGPTVRESAIVYDEIDSVDDLPAGWTDEQEAGTYRIKRRTDGALFGYVVGPQSWKKFLFPPNLRLWKAQRSRPGFQIAAEEEELPHFAFIGVRPCELQALAIQDQVFVHGKHADPVYQARRNATFVVAVNCGLARGTCFCVSMKTGPRARSGFDICLTELAGDGKHRFVAEPGSDRGAKLLRELPQVPATEDDRRQAKELTDQTAKNMGRTLNTDGIKDLLLNNLDHPRWDEVADRCMTCANCTMVCPTCFCTTVEDATDLGGNHAERWRRWDSCFTMDFSYIHGGSVRTSSMARYRQWMIHKLASWIDQFGTSGCVGCGRCITWCPVGIDITEEARTIRESDRSRKESADGNA